METRVIKSFLDLVILGELTKGRPLGGYDVFSLITSKFGVFISPGTIYSVLRSLEREDLIARALEGKRNVYLLTDKGKDIVKDISKTKKRIMNLILNLF